MSSIGLRLIEPTYLYNVLNKETNYPCLSDPVYMLLLDAREEDDYNEGHVITSKLVRKNNAGEFVVPYGADLECKTHVVVYDGCTDFLDEETPAVLCARKMWDMGSRNTVEVLRGGYELFSAIYPFLRTTTIIYMPRELDELQTYPTEIVPASLYLGNWTHGTCAYIQKDLKIKAHIICETSPGTFYIDELKEGVELLHLANEDDDTVDLLSEMPKACEFIDRCIKSRQAVLVFSLLGISRSVAIVMAYLIYQDNLSVEEAFKLVRGIRPRACPNQSFVRQLEEWSLLYPPRPPRLDQRTSQDTTMSLDATAILQATDLEGELEGEEGYIEVGEDKDDWMNWVGAGERVWEWEKEGDEGEKEGQEERGDGGERDDEDNASEEKKDVEEGRDVDEERDVDREEVFSDQTSFEGNNGVKDEIVSEAL